MIHKVCAASHGHYIDALSTTPLQFLIHMKMVTMVMVMFTIVIIIMTMEMVLAVGQGMLNWHQRVARCSKRWEES